MGRRARGLALLGASAACAGLAASSVNRYTRDVRAQVGPLVPAVVARTELSAGQMISAGLAARTLEVRRVPERFAPPRALHEASAAVGYRIASAIRPGDYVTDANLATARGRGGDPEVVGRVVEVPVAGAAGLGNGLRAGTRVDVLITTDRGTGAGRTYLALQNAELIAFTPGQAGAPDEDAKARAALRVTLRQAVLLTAAQNFARELRLVPRPVGDRRKLGPAAVTAAGLGD